MTEEKLVFKNNQNRRKVYFSNNIDRIEYERKEKQRRQNQSLKLGPQQTFWKYINENQMSPKEAMEEVMKQFPMYKENFKRKDKNGNTVYISGREIIKSWYTGEPPKTIDEENRENRENQGKVQKDDDEAR